MIAWHGALGLIQHTEELKELRNLAIKGYRADILKVFASRLSLTEIASRLEDFAKGLRDWDDSPPGLFVPSGVKVSRKDQSGLRVRKIFVQQVSDFLHKHCGQWRDWEVLVLTEIAFPGQRLDEEQIRTMRRSERPRR